MPWNRRRGFDARILQVSAGLDRGDNNGATHGPYCASIAPRNVIGESKERHGALRHVGPGERCNLPYVGMVSLKRELRVHLENTSPTRKRRSEVVSKY